MDFDAKWLKIRVVTQGSASLESHTMVENILGFKFPQKNVKNGLL